MNQLTAHQAEFYGKTTNKDKVVTCGGINLKEIDIRTKVCFGLHIAGECLNLDGITGEVNSQNASVQPDESPILAYDFVSQ
jgi:predicted flavoprotein YhiN